MTPPSQQLRPLRPLRRRSFLLASGVAAAAFVGGCGAVDDLLDNEPEADPQAPAPSADERLLESARSDQQRVLAGCVAVRAAHKPVRDLLAPIIDHHRTHVEILGGEPSDGAARADVPADQTRALQRLRDLEQRASAQRADDASRARAGEFARVLAGISASQAQHAYLIEQALEEARS
ncbi:MAG: hypothetical protein ACRDO7_03875 [Nocardioidaceae bacterium]